MNIRTKTAVGILGATATAALAVGVASPALAGDHRSPATTGHGGDHASSSTWSQHDYWSQRETTLTGGDISNESPVVVAPQVHTGDILGGGILNGNEVGNGAVVASGNDAAIGSGNTTGIAGVEGVDVDASDLVDSTLGDLTGSVGDLLDDIEVTLDGMLGD